VSFAAEDNLGLSDIALGGRELLVAASGYRCFARDCPAGRLGAPRLFFLPLDGRATWPFVSRQPANRNAAGLYTHRATGRTYVISAGDYHAGHGSLQRVRRDRSLGREIRLPVNAAPHRAFPLSRREFVVLSFAGDHLFVIDADRDRLRRVLAFDGQRFVGRPDDGAVPDRKRAELRDLLPDPRAENVFFIVDSLGQRLLHVRYREAEAMFDLVDVIPLKTPAFRSGPDWAVWLGPGRSFVPK
jgi:hypothetical protein